MRERWVQFSCSYVLRVDSPQPSPSEPALLCCPIEVHCSSSECCTWWGAGTTLMFWAQNQVLHLSHELMIEWVGHLSSTHDITCERSNGDSVALLETLGLGHLHSDNKTSSAGLWGSGLLSWALQLVREKGKRRLSLLHPHHRWQTSRGDSFPTLTTSGLAHPHIHP